MNYQITEVPPPSRDEVPDPPMPCLCDREHWTEVFIENTCSRFYVAYDPSSYIAGIYDGVNARWLVLHGIPPVTASEIPDRVIEAFAAELEDLCSTSE